MSLARKIALLLVCLSSTACSSIGGEPEPVWVEGAVGAVPSDRVIWKVALLSLDLMGYKRSQLDPASLVVVSGWKNELAPFSRAGFRTRAEVRLEPLGRREWTIKTRVKKQINNAITNPLDARYAEWQWVDDDPLQAQVLLQHIRSRFDPIVGVVAEEQREEDPIEALLRTLDEQ